jgi:hypothetical protein
MSNVQELLERQARWQKTRQALSWPEKIRMAEMVLESARQFRTANLVDQGKHAHDRGEGAKTPLDWRTPGK